MLSLINISKNFGKHEVLRDINLNVSKGEVLAIIGPSGIGKTTILHLMGLLDSPTRGTILFAGQDVNGSERLRTAFRRRMAIVTQKPVLFNTNVYDNVAYGLKVRRESRALIDEKVSKTLALVGLTGYEKRNARRLSGGEAQRVALARAIVLQPEVLLLDEPTANLDPVSTADVEMLLSRIISELKTTVVLATHDMAQGQRLADRIAVLMDGQISQLGAAEDVFRSPQSTSIARFVGVENLIDGVIESSDGELVTIDINKGKGKVEGVSSIAIGQKVTVGIRPEDIVLAPDRTPTSARNVFPGRITRVVSHGSLARVELDCGFPLIVLVTRHSVEGLDLRPEKSIYTSFKATAIHVIERD